MQEAALRQLELQLRLPFEYAPEEAPETV